MAKIIVVTQAVDEEDSNLAFFVGWLAKMAQQADLEVLTLRKGRHTLPANVKIHLLDEGGFSRARKWGRYQKLLLKLLPESRGIFFHMCPEYVVGAGLWPFMFRKKTLFWYTHKKVNWLLRLAEKLVDKIFTASPESFRLPSSKLEVTGHGIDLDLFRPAPASCSGALKLLTAGRISPVKDLETLISAVGILRKNIKTDIIFDIVGKPFLPSDEKYKIGLEKRVESLGLSGVVRFQGSRFYRELPDVYRSHDIFLHASRTGSIDKAVLEALASGLAVFTSSEAYGKKFSTVLYRFEPQNSRVLAEKIPLLCQREEILKSKEKERKNDFVRKNFDLNSLIHKIVVYFT